MTGSAEPEASAPDLLDTDRFDDYLGLARRSFAGLHAVTFHGRSGAGKSTAVAYLLAHHPDFSGSHGAGLTVFDDLEAAHQVSRIAAALRQGRRVLAACHFHAAWLLPLRLRWRLAAFDLDHLPAKIERWLDVRGIAHTPGAVAAFCRLFGANYTDAEIIVERAPGESFDVALRRFLRQCRLEETEG